MNWSWWTPYRQGFRTCDARSASTRSWIRQISSDVPLFPSNFCYKDRDSDRTAVVDHQPLVVIEPGASKVVPWSARRRKSNHWKAFIMLNPVLVMDLRQAQFPQRASVASEMIYVHQILREIAIAIKRQRAAMRAANQRVHVVQLRLLTYSDRRCDHNFLRAILASSNRSMYDLFHAVMITLAHHWDGADRRLRYQWVAALFSYLDVRTSLRRLNESDHCGRFLMFRSVHQSKAIIVSLIWFVNLDADRLSEYSLLANDLL